MSAYDKAFSDAIYGSEEDGRYVTESRLKKMLGHEMRLVEERISREDNPNYLFFTYANTVATIERQTGKRPELVDATIPVQTGVAHLVERAAQGYVVIRP